MEKTLKRNIIILMILLLIAVAVTTIGLGITIKYPYLKKISRYHEGSCYKNNCSMTQTQCCTSDGINNNCETCYDVEITYSLMYQDNKGIYPYKKIAKINVFDPKYCDQFNLDYNVKCYYDDNDNINDILNSLQLGDLYLYKACADVLHIIVLSCWTVVSLYLKFLMYTTMVRNQNVEISLYMYSLI